MNLKGVILDTLRYASLIRNKFVHEHFKIDERSAAKTKIFFDSSIKLLKRHLVS